jgi:hypothetical protein
MYRLKNQFQVQNTIFWYLETIALSRFYRKEMPIFKQTFNIKNPPNDRVDWH